MRKISFVLVMSLLTFVGCRQEPSDNTIYTIQDYFPLKVGNIWVYQGDYGGGYCW